MVMTDTPAGAGTSYVTTRDGARMFYKDWGTGQPVVFSHGWPLNADAWDDQLNLRRLRSAIAPSPMTGVGTADRARPGTATTWTPTPTTWPTLIETLDLRDVVLVGHSTGGGEVTRYVGRHGTERVAKARAGRRHPAADAQDGGESGRTADRGVRRDPCRRLDRPLAVLPGPQRRVLRRQPAGRAGVARASGTPSGCRACRSG